MKRAAFFLLIFLSVAVRAAEQREALLRGDSGMYGGGVFTVGIDRKGFISGVFNDGECSFFFSGVLTSDGYRIHAWDTRVPSATVVPGEIRFREFQDRQGFYVKIPNVRLLVPCQTVAPYLARGEFIPVDSTGDWNAIRVVSALQTNFWDQPGVKRRRAYLVKGDVVRSYKLDKGWVDAEYDSVRGWINEADLVPLN